MDMGGSVTAKRCRIVRIGVVVVAGSAGADVFWGRWGLKKTLFMS